MSVTEFKHSKKNSTASAVAFFPYVGTVITVTGLFFLTKGTDSQPFQTLLLMLTFSGKYGCRCLTEEKPVDFIMAQGWVPFCWTACMKGKERRGKRRMD